MDPGEDATTQDKNVSDRARKMSRRIKVMTKSSALVNPDDIEDEEERQRVIEKRKRIRASAREGASLKTRVSRLETAIPQTKSSSGVKTSIRIRKSARKSARRQADPEYRNKFLDAAKDNEDTGQSNNGENNSPKFQLQPSSVGGHNRESVRNIKTTISTRRRAFLTAQNANAAPKKEAKAETETGEDAPKRMSRRIKVRSVKQSKIPRPGDHKATDKLVQDSRAEEPTTGKSIDDTTEEKPPVSADYTIPIRPRKLRVSRITRYTDAASGVSKPSLGETVRPSRRIKVSDRLAPNRQADDSNPEVLDGGQSNVDKENITKYEGADQPPVSQFSSRPQRIRLSRIAKFNNRNHKAKASQSEVQEGNNMEQVTKPRTTLSTLTVDGALGGSNGDPVTAIGKPRKLRMSKIARFQDKREKSVRRVVRASARHNVGITERINNIKHDSGYREKYLEAFNEEGKPENGERLNAGGRQFRKSKRIVRVSCRNVPSLASRTQQLQQSSEESSRQLSDIRSKRIEEAESAVKRVALPLPTNDNEVLPSSSSEGETREEETIDEHPESAESDDIDVGGLVEDTYSTKMNDQITDAVTADQSPQVEDSGEDVDPTAVIAQTTDTVTNQSPEVEESEEDAVPTAVNDHTTDAVTKQSPEVEESEEDAVTTVVNDRTTDAVTEQSPEVEESVEDAVPTAVNDQTTDAMTKQSPEVEESEEDAVPTAVNDQTTDGVTEQSPEVEGSVEDAVTMVVNDQTTYTVTEQSPVVEESEEDAVPTTVNDQTTDAVTDQSPEVEESEEDAVLTDVNDQITDAVTDQSPELAKADDVNDGGMMEYYKSKGLPDSGDEINQFSHSQMSTQVNDHVSEKVDEVDDNELKEITSGGKDGGDSVDSSSFQVTAEQTDIITDSRGTKYEVEDAVKHPDPITESGEIEAKKAEASLEEEIVDQLNVDDIQTQNVISDEADSAETNRETENMPSNIRNKTLEDEKPSVTNDVVQDVISIKSPSETSYTEADVDEANVELQEGLDDTYDGTVGSMVIKSDATTSNSLFVALSSDAGEQGMVFNEQWRLGCREKFIDTYIAAANAPDDDQPDEDTEGVEERIQFNKDKDESEIEQTKDIAEFAETTSKKDIGNEETPSQTTKENHDENNTNEDKPYKSDERGESPTILENVDGDLKSTAKEEGQAQPVKIQLDEGVTHESEAEDDDELASDEDLYVEYEYASNDEEASSEYDEDAEDEEVEYVYVDEDGEEVPLDEDEYETDEVVEEGSEDEVEYVYVDEDGNEIQVDKDNLEFDEDGNQIIYVTDSEEEVDDYEYLSDADLEETDEEVIYMDEDGNYVDADGNPVDYEPGSDDEVEYVEEEED